VIKTQYERLPKLTATAAENYPSGLPPPTGSPGNTADYARMRVQSTAAGTAPTSRSEYWPVSGALSPSGAGCTVSLRAISGPLTPVIKGQHRSLADTSKGRSAPVTAEIPTLPKLIARDAEISRPPGCRREDAVARPKPVRRSVHGHSRKYGLHDASYATDDGEEDHQSLGGVDSDGIRVRDGLTFQGGRPVG
jgi:hypothetical protein